VDPALFLDSSIWVVDGGCNIKEVSRRHQGEIKERSTNLLTLMPHLVPLELRCGVR
jgi:hypothetical protein